MLCSAAELGLAESAEGLLELDPRAPVGADYRAQAGLDEAIIELDLTPDRGDCLSVRGIARELATVYEDELGGPALEAIAPARGDTVAVELAAPEACPRYAGRVLRGVDAHASTPTWLAERLRRAGVRPVSAVVDITNYVMLELGQPMHAFDARRLTGSMGVRWARAGESLRLLDERTVDLADDTLVIADGSGPVALAGIMGGAATAVHSATVDVFLESAHFRPSALAGRARRYAAHSDSSHRFERGVDPQLPVVAIERATALIQAICGGEAGRAEDTVEPAHVPEPAEIVLRRDRLERVLGHQPDSSWVERMLDGLGLRVTADEGDWRALAPTWRHDLTIEADLIEEVARLYGYNRSPRTHPAYAPRIAADAEARQSPERLRDVLVERDYAEAITYSFVDSGLQAQLDPDTTALALANPIASDMDVMRTQLWPGLLRTLQHNRNRQSDRVRLFEVGRRFRPGADGVLAQEDVIGGIADGPVWPEQWSAQRRAVDFFDVKGDVEGLLASAGPERFAFEAERHPALHPGQSARIREADGTTVGWLGTLDPRIQQALDLARAPVLFELALEPICRTALPAFQSISRFPAIRRDLAVIVDENVPVQALVDRVRAAAPAELREVFVFDVYQGSGIDSGRKSVALGLILQGLSRTLADTEIEAATADIRQDLRTTHGATLRE
jgi:phenylalanyl-tRNA synthetase beta chain